MNHRWRDNVCEKCKITRVRKEYSRVIRTYSRLGRDGIFYDVPVYQYGTAWFYLIKIPELKNGSKGTFERPTCMLPTTMSETSNKTRNIF